MDLFGKLKVKVDANGDGKLSKEDLDAMRNNENGVQIDKLKAVTDQNEDGKLSIDDIKSFDPGGTFEDAKKLF